METGGPCLEDKGDNVASGDNTGWFYDVPFQHFGEQDTRAASTVIPTLRVPPSRVTSRVTSTVVLEVVSEVHSGVVSGVVADLAVM
jgi:hypothetical protein